jgi:hypothetical protein
VAEVVSCDVPHYYLRLNPDIQKYLGADLPGEGWAKTIVDDLTESGTQLSAVILPADEHGLQIAIYRDRFFARASTDKYRNDSLWVSR